jgi:hypothetical protein
MSKHSDGKPIEIIPTLQTNYKDVAKRYELAERMVWAKTANWKKAVIVHCKLTQTDDRILCEYAHEIVQLAESETVLDEKLAVVPAFTMESETEETAANPS